MFGSTDASAGASNMPISMHLHHFVLPSPQPDVSGSTQGAASSNIMPGVDASNNTQGTNASGIMQSIDTRPAMEQALNRMLQGTKRKPKYDPSPSSKRPSSKRRSHLGVWQYLFPTPRVSSTARSTARRVANMCGKGVFWHLHSDYRCDFSPVMFNLLNAKRGNSTVPTTKRIKGPSSINMLRYARSQIAPRKLVEKAYKKRAIASPDRGRIALLEPKYRDSNYSAIRRSKPPSPMRWTKQSPSELDDAIVGRNAKPKGYVATIIPSLFVSAAAFVRTVDEAMSSTSERVADETGPVKEDRAADNLHPALYDLGAGAAALSPSISPADCQPTITAQQMSHTSASSTTRVDKASIYSSAIVIYDTLAALVAFDAARALDRASMESQARNDADVPRVPEPADGSRSTELSFGCSTCSAASSNSDQENLWSSLTSPVSSPVSTPVKSTMKEAVADCWTSAAFHATVVDEGDDHGLLEPEEVPFMPSSSVVDAAAQSDEAICTEIFCGGVAGSEEGSTDQEAAPEALPDDSDLTAVGGEEVSAGEGISHTDNFKPLQVDNTGTVETEAEDTQAEATEVDFLQNTEDAPIHQAESRSTDETKVSLKQDIGQAVTQEQLEDIRSENDASAVVEDTDLEVTSPLEDAELAPTEYHPYPTWLSKASWIPVSDFLDLDLLSDDGSPDSVEEEDLPATNQNTSLNFPQVDNYTSDAYPEVVPAPQELGTSSPEVGLRSADSPADLSTEVEISDSSSLVEDPVMSGPSEDDESKDDLESSFWLEDIKALLDDQQTTEDADNDEDEFSGDDDLSGILDTDSVGGCESDADIPSDGLLSLYENSESGRPLFSNDVIQQAAVTVEAMSSNESDNDSSSYDDESEDGYGDGCALLQKDSFSASPPHDEVSNEETQVDDSSPSVESVQVDAFSGSPLNDELSNAEPFIGYGSSFDETDNEDGIGIFSDACWDDELTGLSDLFEEPETIVNDPEEAVVKAENGEGLDMMLGPDAIIEDTDIIAEADAMVDEKSDAAEDTSDEPSSASITNPSITDILLEVQQSPPGPQIDLSCEAISSPAAPRAEFTSNLPSPANTSLDPQPAAPASPPPFRSPILDRSRDLVFRLHTKPSPSTSRPSIRPVRRSAKKALEDVLRSDTEIKSTTVSKGVLKKTLGIAWGFIRGRPSA